MFTGKVAKKYLSEIINDMDSGKAPSRERASRWVRAVAVPAAIGFSMGLGLVGCTGDDPESESLNKDEVRQSKADGFEDDLCQYIGVEAPCDLCLELDWYGDGYCDDFCDSPDPDCATQEQCVEASDCDCTPGDDRCPDGYLCLGDEDGAECVMPMVPMYGVPMPEQCVDPNNCDCTPGDDRCPDGYVCLGDEDGAECVMPMVPMYGVPMPEVCEDASDCDCMDPGLMCPDGYICFDDEEGGDCFMEMIPVYAAPPPE